MPESIEYSFIWNLARPSFAAATGLFYVFCVAAILFYMLGKSRKPGRHVKLVALIAECLVSVGVMGAIMLVARLQLDQASIQAHDDRTRQQSQMASAMGRFSSSYCTRTPVNIKPGAMLLQGCEVAHTFRDAFNDDQNWLDAAEGFRAAALYSLQESPPAAALFDLSLRASALHQARHSGALQKWMRIWQTRDESVFFLIFSAISSCTGVGLKVGRALHEWQRA